METGNDSTMVSRSLIKNVLICRDAWSTVCTLLPPSAHTGAVNSVSFHPSGNYLLSASSDHSLKARVCVCVCVCVAGNYLLSASSDHSLKACVCVCVWLTPSTILLSV